MLARKKQGQKTSVRKRIKNFGFAMKSLQLFVNKEKYDKFYFGYTDKDRKSAKSIIF